MLKAKVPKTEPIMVNNDLPFVRLTCQIWHDGDKIVQKRRNQVPRVCQTHKRQALSSLAKLKGLFNVNISHFLKADTQYN